MGIIHEQGDVRTRRSGHDRRVQRDSGYRGPERRVTGDRRQRKDKRCSRRYAIPYGVFAQLRTDGAEDLGELLDISLTGAGIRYFTTADHPKVYTECDILLPDAGYALNGISFRKITDVALERESVASCLAFRRLGIQFEAMGPDQQTGLSRLIREYSLP